MNTENRTGKKSRLYVILAGNYISFTVLMLTAFLIIYYISLKAADRIAPIADPAGLIHAAMEMEDAMLPELKVERYLGKGSQAAVLAEDGRVIYATEELVRTRYPERLLECLQSMDSQVRTLTAVLPENEENARYLITGTQYGEGGYFSVTGYLLLDEERKVLDGTLFPGRSFFSDEEFQYLSGHDEKGRSLYLEQYENRQGQKRQMLLGLREPANEAYQRAYRIQTRIFWLVAPVYIVLAAVCIYRLSRRIRRFLQPFLGGIENLEKGRPSGMEHYQGPAEFSAIAARFVEMERQLQKSEAERIKLDGARRQLLADISHDLKTPAAVIRGCAQALQDGMIPEEKRSGALDTIIRKADQVSSLLSAFHEYSKLEHPQMPVNRKLTDVGYLVREYFAGRYQELEMNDIFLEADIEETPCMAMADPSLLLRALENLVNNAAVYNPPGTRILAYLRREGDRLRISIADDGKGIPDELREKLFEPFVTGDAARSGSHGSGLGLAITKKIILLHEGTIQAAPDPLPGWKTEFRISLPLAES